MSEYKINRYFVSIHSHNNYLRNLLIFVYLILNRVFNSTIHLIWLSWSIWLFSTPFNTWMWQWFLNGFRIEISTHISDPGHSWIVNLWKTHFRDTTDDPFDVYKRIYAIQKYGRTKIIRRRIYWKSKTDTSFKDGLQVTRGPPKRRRKERERRSTWTKEEIRRHVETIYGDNIGKNVTRH